jgi:hypothetical protein
VPLPSIASDIPLDQAGQAGGPTPAAAPPLSFFDQTRLGFKVAGAQADWGWNQHNYEVGAYHEIRQALEAKGYKLPQTPLLSSGDEADFYASGYHPGQPWLAGPKARERYDAFWQAFADARARDANFAPAYKDVHDFGTLLDHVRGQRNSDVTDVAARAPDGLGAGGFVGQLGRAALDPLSWIPLAGPEVEAATTGGRILARALGAAAVNGGITAGLEPFVQRDAAAIGQNRTAGDFVSDLLASTAFGFALGGAHEALRLPASPFHSFDATVARPSAKWSRGAAHARRAGGDPRDRARRRGQGDLAVRAGPAGDDAHAQALDRGHARVNNGAAQRGAGQAGRARDASPARGRRRGALPARELLKAKIHASRRRRRPEPRRRRALGPYQFEPRTWVSLFKRRYPGDKRSFDQIAALREDPHLNDVLINDLLARMRRRCAMPGSRKMRATSISRTCSATTAR